MPGGRRPLLRTRLALLAIVWVGGCGSDDPAGTIPTPPNQPGQPGQPSLPATPTPPLRDLAAGVGLRIGAAVDQEIRLTGQAGTNARTVLVREFNATTPGNVMKHDHIHPSPTTYAFQDGDSLVAFAEANGMVVRGHTLVWHNQLASWLTGGTWTQPQAESLLVTHITTVVSHYRGHVVAWDVVNEALADNGARRATFWSNAVGPAYIEKAFRAARAADATVLLFYNDYNIEGTGPKADSAYAMLSDLKSRGVPVDGIGFQAHFQVGGLPTRSDMIANFTRFAALGLKIHITELDVRVPLPATAVSLQTQAQNYRDVVDACRQVSACTMVVLWGFTDAYSWVPSTFSGWGAALPFDASYNPKPAYQALHDLLSTTTQSRAW